MAWAPRMPRQDERDVGSLPESLVPLSVALAMLLRYRKHGSDEDGWMRVDDALAQLRNGVGSRGCVVASEQDVEVVVKESFSKNQRRFESERRLDGILYVRARAADEYRRRQKTNGSSTASWGGSFAGNGVGHVGSTWSRAGPSSDRGYADNHIVGFKGNIGGLNGSDGGLVRSTVGHIGSNIVDQNSVASSDTLTHNTSGVADNAVGDSGDAKAGLPLPPESTVGSKYNSCDFDGDWITQDQIVCTIAGNELTWAGAQATQKIQVQCDEIFFYDPDAGDASATSGKLNAHGQIQWSDGDVWSRMVSLGDKTALSATTAEPTASEGVSESWIEGLGVPQEHRAAADFAGKEWGSEYLNLVSGELLLVQPLLQDDWAYGYSVQRDMYGWFPPTYVKPPPGQSVG